MNRLINTISDLIGHLVAWFVFVPLDYAICRIHHRHP